MRAKTLVLVAVCLNLSAALTARPAAGQVQMGVQTGDSIPPLGELEGPASEPGFVNFDDFGAPSGFISTVATRDEFAAFGVTFAGPSALDGGGVLNETSNFGVEGYSPPNFLAFNIDAVYSDGGVPRGPETMIFDPPVTSVGISCGIGLGGRGFATLQCFDGAVLVGTSEVSVFAILQPLSVDGPLIDRCVLSFETSVGGLACDDLTFAEIPVELESFEIEK